MSGSFAQKDWPLGGLFPIDQPHASSLPLRSTTVTAHLLGPLADVTVVQAYQNPFDYPLELVYIFPLPDQAAIFDFEFEIGGVKVKADIQPVEAARERYEQALHMGKRASLFEELRPNLFTLQMANVQPGEEMAAVIRYQQPLRFEENWYEWVFPMGVTPKYHRDAAEAAEIDSPQALPGEKIGGVALSIHLDAGGAAMEPVSPSHPLKITRVDDRTFDITLDGEHIPDKDFVLRYRLEERDIQVPVWVSENGAAATALVVLVPNSWPTEVAAPPREFVFVLDRSGSMAGEPLRQACNALAAGLRTLRAEDTFLLMAFNNSVAWFNDMPVPFSQAGLDRADAWLSRLRADGGTEIGLAMNAALELPEDTERRRHIVFFTDGAVSAERQVLADVRRKIRSTRLFTFGIGPSVNRAFISSLARLGRGTSEFLQLDEDIESAIIRFHDRLSYPLLRDLHLRWEGTSAWDQLPAELPDLYYGQPLQFCAKFRPAPDTRLFLSGKCGDEEWQKVLLLPQPVGREEVILRSWAKARIDAVLEQQQATYPPAQACRDEIISLALEYHLLTEYTSFVAVQEESASQLPAKQLKIAVPLPQGLRREGFLGGSVVACSMPAGIRPDAGLKSNIVYRLMERKNIHLLQDRSVKRDLLQKLARSQKADGSWGDDADAMEWTCAAVLAFVRRGHSLQKGTYRRILENAVAWLLQHPAKDALAEQMRALALWEVRQACAHPMVAGIGAVEENIVRSILPPDFTVAGTAEQLRWAAMTRSGVIIVFKPEEGEVGEIWLECLAT
jgi:Ca-activated chloride channel family protein